MSEAPKTDIRADYIEESSPPSTFLESRQSNLQPPTASTQDKGDSKKLTSDNKAADLPDSDPEPDSNTNLISTSTQISEVKDLTTTTNTTSDMADGRKRSSKSKAGSRANEDSENEARALRVLEIMNDFRTLQVQITSLVTREDATPPDSTSSYLDGYALLRQCHAEAQAILATQYNPGSLGIEPGRVPDTEVQKATLQRIILDASTRRFQAHKTYLLAAASIRWVMLRKQVMDQEMPAARRQAALATINQRLTQERAAITDEHVVTDLRNADRGHGYWINEDPSLERMLSWIRRQR